MKKILLLLPDGVGVRNFVYSKFIKKSNSVDTDITLCSDESIFSLIEADGIVLPDNKALNPLGDFFRIIWQKALLKSYAKRFQDPVFRSYIIRKRNVRWLTFLKDYLTDFISEIFFSLQINSLWLRKCYLAMAHRGVFYQNIYVQLQQQKPDLVFCTHQRSISAISILCAARALKIPTVSFIYSWDNIPKATLFVEADYYLVWSAQMKAEMRLYHPEISAHRVVIVGTPQFEPYFDKRIILPRDFFARDHHLPVDRLWICYSGDDITTSPNDPAYLMDLARAIRSWNEKEIKKLHIIFRRCPVDLSDRFKQVLLEYEDVITPINPDWQYIYTDSGWHTILPKPTDTSLLVNTVQHCALVVNVGSTMAHDFAILGKPCMYINYNVSSIADWNIYEVYKYIHFRTMEGLDPVIWINHPNEWEAKLKIAIETPNSYVQDCKAWHERVAMYPLEKSTERIVNFLHEKLLN